MATAPAVMDHMQADLRYFSSRRLTPSSPARRFLGSLSVAGGIEPVLRNMTSLIHLVLAKVGLSGKRGRSESGSEKQTRIGPHAPPRRDLVGRVAGVVACEAYGEPAVLSLLPLRGIQ